LYNLVFQLWVGQFLEKKVRDTLQQFWDYKFESTH
jgi:hypothetical protein